MKTWLEHTPVEQEQLIERVYGLLVEVRPANGMNAAGLVLATGYVYAELVEIVTEGLAILEARGRVRRVVDVIGVTDRYAVVV